MGDETTLFYSKFCSNCKLLLHTLSTNKLLGKITTYYCIDNANNNGIRRDLPNFLKMVPSIITPEVPDKILEGKDAFIWVDYLLKANDTVTGCGADGFCSWDSNIDGPNKSITEIIQEDDPNAIDSMYGASITGIQEGTDVTKPLKDDFSSKDSAKRLEEIQKMRQQEDALYSGKR